MRSPQDSQTKKLIKNIAAEKWCEVSNAVLKHEELAPELKKGINEVISREISEYLKSGGMLEARSADEQAGFSNKSFMDVYCPAWFQCTLGACGLSQEYLSKNATMFHSGVKHDDLILNRLMSVCLKIPLSSCKRK